MFAALQAEGVAKAKELLPQAYADTPKFLYPLAERACLAHLIKLVADGRAEALDDGRYRVDPKREG